MSPDKFQQIFSSEKLQEMFPAGRSNEFFEALYGDIEEGVYDISLAYEGYSAEDNALHFLFKLTERQGKCLACHLTSGLPEVFSRHPVIGVASLVKQIDQLLGDGISCESWRLSSTRPVSPKIYGVPLTISLR